MRRIISNLITVAGVFGTSFGETRHEQNFELPRGNPKRTKTSREYDWSGTWGTWVASFFWAELEPDEKPENLDEDVNKQMRKVCNG